jgi:hypothetical protein
MYIYVKILIYTIIKWEIYAVQNLIIFYIATSVKKIGTRSFLYIVVIVVKIASSMNIIVVNVDTVNLSLNMNDQIKLDICIVVDVINTKNTMIVLINHILIKKKSGSLIYDDIKSRFYVS